MRSSSYKCFVLFVFDSVGMELFDMRPIGFADDNLSTVFTGDFLFFLVEAE
jgi:hypothetical protein